MNEVRILNYTVSVVRFIKIAVGNILLSVFGIILLRQYGHKGIWQHIVPREARVNLNNTMVYSPIMENAIMLLVGIGIIVAIIFGIIWLLTLIQDGLTEICAFFGHEC